MVERGVGSGYKSKRVALHYVSSDISGNHAGVPQLVMNKETIHNSIELGHR